MPTLAMPYMKQMIQNVRVPMISRQRPDDFVAAVRNFGRAPAAHAPAPDCTGAWAPSGIKSHLFRASPHEHGRGNNDQNQSQHSEDRTRSNASRPRRTGSPSRSESRLWTSLDRRLAIAIARPRLRTNQREIVTLTTIWHINTPPMVTKTQRTNKKLPEGAHLAEQYETDAGRQRAAGHQPTAAVAVDQRPDQRRQCAAPRRISPERSSRKQPARNRQILGQRLEKHAQGARHMKRASHLRKKSHGDDIPAVENFWFLNGSWS